MGIIGWIVLGLVVGALAKLVMPGDDGGGIVLTILLGIVGALLGGFVGRLIFGTDLGGFFDLRTWVLALLGSLIVLGIYRLVTRRHART
ncbi:GlsB/YeaQ/YmgE family stress response membrane protein [Actinomycetospora atypica]|uniref:GlsB/YeaQ/YmgE family stress response membrane protein n=1 Tax=Actinomycetospora atypica TaxID=1290095 RepID=A0ABV9YLN5_9PSEU